MSILVAPDSFKGTYSAAEVAHAISVGIREGGGHAMELPVADGGEGTYDALCHSLDASSVQVNVINAWGEPIEAIMGLAADGTAVIEVAQASGLTPTRNTPKEAVEASTYGTGMLIATAIDRGARRILVAAGGSATTDGGSGAVQAIEDGGGIRGAHITVLSDVTTTFIDAARVFGPQKGADETAVRLLENRLVKLAAAYPRNPSGVPRTGAAGGLSGALWAYYGAGLISGAEAVLDASSFDRHLEACKAVVVGEGRLDSQTGEGKVISAILERVRKVAREIPVIAVVGSVHADLGSYAENFAQILIASDAAALQAAGKAIALG